MPWEKQFDVDDALTKAMHAFWARGYEATSIRDLVDRMGINRGSIYATFGDKRSLFIQALRHYDTRHREAWLGAREAIRATSIGSATLSRTTPSSPRPISSSIPASASA